MAWAYLGTCAVPMLVMPSTTGLWGSSMRPQPFWKCGMHGWTLLTCTQPPPCSASERKAIYLSCPGLHSSIYGSPDPGGDSRPAVSTHTVPSPPSNTEIIQGQAGDIPRSWQETIITSARMDWAVGAVRKMSAGEEAPVS